MGTHLARAKAACFMLKQLRRDSHSKQAPFVSHAVDIGLAADRSFTDSLLSAAPQ